MRSSGDAGTARSTLRVGRQVHAVSSLAEASALYAEERDRSGLGASRFREGRIVTVDGEELRVSYNARIWRGEWPNAELVYDPAAATESLPL